MRKRILLLALLPLALLPFAAAAAVTTVQATTDVVGAYDKVAIAISAGIAIGLSSLGAGLAISSAGSAAISALAEKPDTFFRSFLIVALAEALAIYGLIMGILLWLKL
jgi:V/A-type H+-transporting ATPase subunit K